jgi:transposase-like protein
MARRRRVWRYSDEFRQAAIVRIMKGELQKDVARDLDIGKRLLWSWRKKLAQGETRTQPAMPTATEDAGEAMRRAEVQQLKELLAVKELVLSFFKGALQKVEARRRQSDSSGAKVSTTKSVQ